MIIQFALWVYSDDQCNGSEKSNNITISSMIDNMNGMGMITWNGIIGMWMITWNEIIGMWMITWNGIIGMWMITLNGIIGMWMITWNGIIGMWMITWNGIIGMWMITWNGKIGMWMITWNGIIGMWMKNIGLNVRANMDAEGIRRNWEEWVILLNVVNTGNLEVVSWWFEFDCT